MSIKSAAATGYENAGGQQRRAQFRWLFGDATAARNRELFGWLESPSAFRLAKVRAPGNPHSLATCEKVPTSGRRAIEEAEIGDAAQEAGTSPAKLAQEIGGDELRGDTAAALQAALARDRERQAQVVELIRQGEVAHAKRLANCGRQSVELKCAGWDGCGTKNYVPISCDSPLCRDCANQRQGRAMGQYRERVKSWGHPTMLRVSHPARVEAEPGEVTAALDELRDAFGKLRRRVIQPEGEHQGKRWVWSVGDDGGDPVDHYWKPALISAVGRAEVARLEKQYVEQGKGIPVSELLREGVYGIDIKQRDDGTLYLHLHILADVPYLPQAALSQVWDELMGAPVVDIRRVQSGPGTSREDALAETIGYAAKPPEYESVKAEVATFRAIKGAKMVQPFGDLHGNTPEVGGHLECGGCERSPALGWDVEWSYEGVVDGRYSGVLTGGPDGDRPPTEGES